ncbi:MAG: hypothetical protein QM765_26610 [Myxococcales bacterium]
MRNTLVGLALSLAALGVAGCPSALSCGPGTHQEGSLCVADGPDATAVVAIDGAVSVDAAGEVGLDAAASGQDAGAGRDAGADRRDAAHDLGDVGFAPHCSSGIPCPSGLICKAGYCTAPPSPCGRDLDCPDNLVCDYGVCVRECRETAECPSDRICRDSRCVEPPNPCVRADDCPRTGETQECVAGKCVGKCTHACGCRAGFDCVAGSCVAVPADDACTTDEVCNCRHFYPGSDENRHCFQGQCGRPCAETCDCGEGSVCQDGHCRPAPEVCHADTDCPCAGGDRLHCLSGQCFKTCTTTCDCAATGAYSLSGRVCFEGFCQLTSWQCAADADCACSGGHQATCDVSSGACTHGACSTGCDCPSGMTCQNGNCQPAGYSSACTTAADCACGQPCLSVGPGFNSCGCTQNWDCRPDKVCDLATRACKPKPATCQSNLDCPYNAASEKTFCKSGTCVGCYPTNDGCYGQDSACSVCDDGTAQICHHKLSLPDDDVNSMCAPACSSNLDCLVIGFGQGVCIAGRCTAWAPDVSVPCTSTADCVAMSRTPLGEVYSPVCQGGNCLPASCETNCDCPAEYPGRFVCRSGKCTAAPEKCANVDDCPCTNSGQVACNAGGVCGPNAY